MFFKANTFNFLVQDVIRQNTLKGMPKKEQAELFLGWSRIVSAAIQMCTKLPLETIVRVATLKVLLNLQRVLTMQKPILI